MANGERSKARDAVFVADCSPSESTAVASPSARPSFDEPRSCSPDLESTFEKLPPASAFSERPEADCNAAPSETGNLGADSASIMVMGLLS